VCKYSIGLLHRRREISAPLRTIIRAMDVKMKGIFREPKGKNKCPKNNAHTTKSHRVVAQKKRDERAALKKFMCPKKKCQNKMRTVKSNRVVAQKKRDERAAL